MYLKFYLKNSLPVLIDTTDKIARMDTPIFKEKIKHTAPIAPNVNNTVLKNLILLNLILLAKNCR